MKGYRCLELVWKSMISYPKKDKKIHDQIGLSKPQKESRDPFPKINLTGGTGAHWQEHFHLVTFEQN